MSARPIPSTARLRLACLLVLVGLVGCDTRSAEPPRPGDAAIGGTLVMATVAEPDLLVPALTLTGTGQQVVDAVFDRLAVPVDDGRTLQGQLARDWSWNGDGLRLDITLHADARWHDGEPVTAHDVAFTWRAYTDSLLASPTSALLGDIDSVTVQDDQVVRLWMRRRSARAERAALTLMRVMPRHRWEHVPRAEWRSVPEARAPIGSGRFRFATWQAGASVVLVADSANYRGRPSLDRVVWSVSPDPTGTLARLIAGEVQFVENVRPDAVPTLAEAEAIRLLRSPSLIYGFAAFNLRARASATTAHPIFGDARVRRALSLAVDRDRLVRAVFDSLARPAIGPLTQAQRDSGAPRLPTPSFDSAQAARLLDEAGWRRAEPDGRRYRDGVPLAFGLLVPSSSTPRVRLAQLVQETWRQHGISVTLEQLEFNTFNVRLADGVFDAAMLAIGADPDPLAIRGVWSRTADRLRGGPNFGGYASATFDSLLAVADAAETEGEERAALDAAYRVILDDTPALWLYEPWNLAAISRSVQPQGIAADGWWFALGDWSLVRSR